MYIRSLRFYFMSLVSRVWVRWVMSLCALSPTLRPSPRNARCGDGGRSAACEYSEHHPPASCLTVAR